MGSASWDYTPVDRVLREVKSRIRLRRRALSMAAKESYGMVCAKDVVAPADVPPSPAAHWDGYAVRTRDLLEASESTPVSLMIRGEVRLGRSPTALIGRGEALGVSTGSTMPPGADAVVPREAAEEEGGRLLVKAAPRPWSHVYRQGEDLRRGDLILKRGASIRATDVGLLLTAGLSRVRVYPRPRVAVVATGSELSDREKPGPGKVRETHTPVLLGLLRAQGCQPLDTGIAVDDRGAIASALRRALALSDFVFTLGGTSHGKRDLLGEVVSGMGPDVFFHGIKMDRGRVTGAGVIRGKPVLMMPGPIQGAVNAYLLLGRPIIESISGSRGGGVEVYGRLAKSWEARKGYADFTKVVYVRLGEGEEPLAEPLSAETESMAVLARANGYLVVPGRTTRLAAGSRVKVGLLPGLSFA